ncbi:MAG TPA: ABC-2 family transporter protein [Symbiobacteriaceae bacterium]
MAKFFAFVGAYLKVNLAAALEYRASAVSQVLGMFINDGLWVMFWMLYFTKFPVIRGWTLEDVVVMWAVVTVSVGLAMGLTFNARRIPELVAQGQLDYYLTLPKDVLLHLLVSRISIFNLGDMLFGPVVLVLLVKLTWARVAVFLVASVLAAIIMMAFSVLTGSLTFYMGNSETLSAQLFNTVLHFSTYPAPIFDTGVKVVLFTLIPAGFISTVPVELVREFHWMQFLELLGAAALFSGLAVVVFRHGLKRYESGNLMMMRS